MSRRQRVGRCCDGSPPLHVENRENGAQAESDDDEAKNDVFECIERYHSPNTALENRIYESRGVRDAGRMRFSSCQPNRRQAPLHDWMRKGPHVSRSTDMFSCAGIQHVATYVPNSKRALLARNLGLDCFPYRSLGKLACCPIVWVRARYVLGASAYRIEK